MYYVIEKYKNYVKEKSHWKEDGGVDIKDIILGIVFVFVVSAIFIVLLSTLLAAIYDVTSNPIYKIILGPAGVSLIDIVPLIFVIVLFLIHFSSKR